MKLPADVLSEGLHPPQHPGFSADELLDTQPWGVLVLDEQHIIRRVNQLAAHWCGVAPAELLGQPLQGDRLLPAIRTTLRQLLEPGEASAREVFLAQQAQWISLSATRRAGGWVLYGQDITPQKQREQQYQALAENTPDVLTRWTPDLRLRYANAALATKTGQPVSALLGRTFAQMGAPADSTGPYMAALQRVFDTGQPQDHYNPFTGPHGTLHYHSRLVPELCDGQVDTVLGIARDITALKQSQAEALRLQQTLTQQATDHYQALFHRLDQGFCVLELQFDQTGQQVVDYLYRQVNPTFAQQLGISGDVLGRHGLDVLPDLARFWFDSCGRVALSGASERLEHYVPPVGRWFEVHIFRVGGPGSREVGVLCHDVTARKQQAQQHAFLLRFSDALRAETSATSVANQALALLSEQLQLDRCYIGVYDLAEDRGIFPHQVGNHRIPPLPAGVRLSDFPDALRVAYDQTLRIDDLAQTAGLSNLDRQNLGALGMRALVAATLRRGGAGPQWAIVALSADVRHWTPGEVALLEEATERTWAAMERARAEAALRHAEERHRAELEQQVAARTQELRESRHLLQTVFDASPTAIVVLRTLRDAAGQAKDFEILLDNKFNRQVVGRDDLVGQRYSEVFAQTVPTGNLARLLAVATTGEPADFEQWYAGEGLRHWFRQIVVRQDGLLVLTSEVITGRKTAEQERARTLHLLEQAEAVAGLGSWEYDQLSQEFRWSEGLYQLFGLPVGQPVRPDVYRQSVVAEDRVLAEELVRHVQTGAGTLEQTLRLRVGEQVKTVRSKVVVLPDEAGKPGRVLGVNLDLTQLQRLQAENLRLRLRQQRALFEAVQAAQEAERRRLAESLHNGIGQILYATKLRLDQLHAPGQSPLPALVAARHEANTLLSEAIRQTRVLSHELVPLVLEKFGLAQALQDIGRNMSTASLRFRCQVVFDEEAVPLSPALQLALYRMAQELTQNIVKHALGATQASLELETMPGWVVLRVEDNGPGFAPASVERPGLGLRSIHDRVVLLEGELDMGLRLDGGAYVRLRIPLGTAAT